ncbi:unnamed protein product [Peniophora sp. CBMAI 1063]|nr:unnamed protein product [Peniophora sp. CBMAI 1063]
MSSPTPSRASSPSLESVSDASDIDLLSPTLPSDDSQVPAPVCNGETGTKANPTIPPEDKTIGQPRLEATDEGADQQTANSNHIPHEKYFFNADMLNLTVAGGTTYRLHKDFFTRSSPYWAKKLASPGLETDLINLPDVRKEEMDAFLSTLYPTSGSDMKAKALEEWVAVLRLSTMWKFKGKRELAISVLGIAAPPLEKLRLARAYDVEAWLHPAFVALCVRHKTLSLKEAEKLPLRDVMRLVSAREALFKGSPPTHEETSAYVAKYIHKPKSPISELSFKVIGDILDDRKDGHLPQPPPVKAPSPPPFEPSTLFATRRPKTPPLTLSGPNATIEEKQKFAGLLSTYQYATAFDAVEEHNVQAFLSLLVDFSKVYRDGSDFRVFADKLITYSVTHSRFVPLSVQILKSIIADLPPSESSFWSFEATQVSALGYMETVRDRALEFWEDLEEAMAKYKDFTLAMAHANLTPSGTHTLITLSLRLPHEKVLQSDYEQRSASLRAIFAALEEAGLLEPQAASADGK